MDLTSQAIDKIVELSPHKDPKVVTYEFNGVTYYLNRNGDLRRMYRDDQHTPGVMHFNTLTGIIDYCTENNDRWDLDKLQIIVDGPNLVTLNSCIDRTNEMKRFLLAQSNSHECEFTFGKPKDGPRDPWYCLLDFVIAMQSQFVQDAETEKIIGWLSHLANEKVVEKKDTGFAQHIQVKTGITSKSQVKIENPVILKPYRTFRELNQPEGKFILRLNEKDHDIMVSLFAADGGAWELDAMDSIKKFIEEKWKAEVKIPILC